MDNGVMIDSAGRLGEQVNAYVPPLPLLLVVLLLLLLLSCCFCCSCLLHSSSCVSFVSRVSCSGAGFTIRPRPDAPRAAVHPSIRIVREWAEKARRPPNAYTTTAPDGTDARTATLPSTATLMTR